MKTSASLRWLLLAAAAPLLTSLAVAQDARANIEVEAKFIELQPRALKALPAVRAYFPESDSPLPSSTKVVDSATAAVLVRQLAQTRGTDTMSVPRVVTHSGQAATIECLRELSYVTDWAPHQKGEPWVVAGRDTKSVGISMNVLATLTADGSIDLVIGPQCVEFLGYVDYQSAKPRLIARADDTHSLLTRELPSAESLRPAGALLQPLFHTRKVDTSLAIQPGDVALICLSTKPEAHKQFGLGPKHLLVMVSARIVE